MTNFLSRPYQSKVIGNWLGLDAKFGSNLDHIQQCMPGYNTDDILWVSTSVGLNKFTVFSEKITESVEDIHVYPNPYEIWGYDFNAVFTNLKPGSEIRIYTFSGVLVNELTVGNNAEDGIATVIWNGKNFEGKYVGSGVYFFTGINAKGQEFKDKLVVVRR